MQRLLILMCVCIIIYLQSGVKPPRKVSQLFVPPPKFIEHATLGYQLMAADLLWLRLVQDIDACGQIQQPASQTVSEYKKEKGTQFKKNDVVDQILMESATEPIKCRYGWSFRMLDAITDLDPKYQIAYRVGGTILSVMTRDRDGARVIYEKGLRQYPNDWVIAYRAAYHYLYELQAPERAAELLLQAAENGGPPWIRVLAGKLYSKVGKLIFGRSILVDFIKRHPDHESTERAKEKLRQIEEEISRTSTSEQGADF